MIKHMPGHGRAVADSHEQLPVVEASREELEAHDFPPFRALADMPLAMTAHVVYAAIDALNPATTSRRVMAEVIRGHLGYDGLVMSDDLSMKALSGGFRERAEAAFAAGCDVALHCNGRMDEMRRRGGGRAGRSPATPCAGPTPRSAACATRRSRSTLWRPAPASRPRFAAIG